MADLRARPVLQATAGGVDITSKVADVEINLDFQKRIGEATLALWEWPDSVNFWDTLQISCGLDGPGCSGLIQRLDGYVWDPGFDLWPLRNVLLGRGPLILADRMKVPTDEELLTVQSPLRHYIPLYDSPGISLNLNPDTLATWTDSEAITWLLGKAGLSSRLGQIGGNPHLLGIYAFDQFYWNRKESALQAIEKYDLIGMGFRVHENLAGEIVRTKLSGVPDFPANYQYQLMESADLLPGSSLRRATSLIKNVVSVEGWNPALPRTWTSSKPHPHPPPDQPDTFPDSDSIQSGMIEWDVPDTRTPPRGLSCKEVAEWALNEKCHDWWQVNLETWRDSPIGPGDAVYVNAPRLGGPNPCNQMFWVSSVKIRMQPNGSWRQSITARAPQYWTGPNVALGNFMLGGSL